MKTLYIHPYIRIFLFLLIILIVFYRNSNFSIGAYVGILTVFFFTNKLTGHLKLFLLGMFPIYLSYFYLYYLIPEAPLPLDVIHLKFLKVILIASAFQLLFSNNFEELVDTIRTLRIKGNLKLIILSTYSMIDEVQKKSYKIISARYAAGYVKKRTWWNAVRQFPYILIPLLTQLLEIAEERSKSWDEKNMVSLLENYRVKIYYSFSFNVCVFLVSLVCLVKVVSDIKFY